ncbi:hypothetical protein ACWGJ9_09050 [Curtobacterium citreum]
MLITIKRAAVALLATSVVAVTLAGCAMSKEEAGKYYLSAVCPANNVGTEYKAAESGDFAALQDVARKSIDIEKASAAKLEDDSVSWPKEVNEDDIQAIADSYYGSVAGMQAVVNAKSIDDADFSFLNSEKGQAEAQRVRAKLGLSSDGEGSCK